MFAEFSTIRFGTYRAHISRKHRMAGIYNSTGEPVGAITRLKRGSLLWESFGPRPLPSTILDTVRTMV